MNISKLRNDFQAIWPSNQAIQRSSLSQSAQELQVILADHKLTQKEYTYLLHTYLDSEELNQPEKIKQFNLTLANSLDGTADGSFKIDNLAEAFDNFPLNQTETIQLNRSILKKGNAYTSFSLETLSSPSAHSENTQSFPGKQPDYFPTTESLGHISKHAPIQVTPVDISLLPDDIRSLSLEAVTKQLNTPDHVAALLGNIPYELERMGGGKGPLATYTPRSVIEHYKGVCRDMHQLGAYILQQHGYEARQMGYDSSRTPHSFTVYFDPKTKEYGAVEYGRHYSPQELTQKLGRKPTSYEDAMSALRPDALDIRRYSEAKADEQGHYDSIYYTRTLRHIIDNMKPDYETSASYSYENGAKVSANVGRFGLTLGYDPLAPGAPAMKDSVYLNAGYWLGDQESYLSFFTAVQYLPENFFRTIGPNETIDNPTLLIGAGIEGQWTPEFLKFALENGHLTYTTIDGEAIGNIAFNTMDTNDQGHVVDEGFGFDKAMSGAARSIRAGIKQHYDIKEKDWQLQNTLFMNGDLVTGIQAYIMGNSTPFVNAGISSVFQYKPDGGPWLLKAGAKVLFHQVDNTEATSVKAGGGYDDGKFLLTANVAYIAPFLYGRGSTELGRVLLEQTMGIKPLDFMQIGFQSSQEFIFAEDQDPYMNQDSIKAQGILKFTF